MVLGLMEVDLEAGFDVESGGGNLNISFAGRLNQVTSDEVRPLLQNRPENQEDLIRLGIKPFKDKNKKIKSKRPPKPPRPPKGPALDASDLKLIRELSELALERRMRIERMKGLKKMRASKAASSNSSSVALIVTVLFCLIILFQGFSSRSGSVTSLQSSSGPILSPSGEELISIQVFKNLSPADYDNGGSFVAQKSPTPAEGEGSTRDAG